MHRLSSWTVGGKTPLISLYDWQSCSTFLCVYLKIWSRRVNLFQGVGKYPVGAYQRSCLTSWSVYLRLDLILNPRKRLFNLWKWLPIPQTPTSLPSTWSIVSAFEHDRCSVEQIMCLIYFKLAFAFLSWKCAFGPRPRLGGPISSRQFSTQKVIKYL